MKSWPFCAVLVPLVWSGLIILGWPSSCRGFWALLLHAANIFACWPANNEARGEECMVVTRWWNAHTLGRSKGCLFPRFGTFLGQPVHRTWQPRKFSCGSILSPFFRALVKVFLAYVFFFSSDGVLAHRPTPQPGGPLYLSLSGCSPLSCAPRVVLPVATLPPA
jgi:hypothetical protein